MVRGGTVVLGDDVVHADLLAVDGTIAAIGSAIDPPLGCAVLDVGGCIVLPGVIDPHVHFGWPGAADDFATGSLAAACGGVTSVLEFAVQFPGTDLSESVDEWLALGRASHVDFGLHAVVSDATPNTLAQLDALIARGVTSFKMFMTSQHSGGLGINDATMLAIMRRLAVAGGLAMAHCENGILVDALSEQLLDEGGRGPLGHLHSRPPFVEAEAVSRAIALASAAGCSFYLPHLSSAMGLEVVEAVRCRGQAVVAETCPQFLALTSDVYEQDDAANFVMSPPIKSADDQARLWHGLLSGAISTVGSDHCPYPSSTRHANGLDDFRRIPNGVPGTETLLPVLFTLGVRSGLITLADMACIVSTNPAEIFGLGHRKGSLTPGHDADITVLDPEGTTVPSADNLHSDIDYSLYDDRTLQGAVALTIVRGQIVAQGGQPRHTGRGQFLPREVSDISGFIRRSALSAAVSRQ